MIDKSRVATFNEGQLLTLAAQRDVPTAAEHARGVIDGCFNALLLFEPTEEVAKFAFAVADRVAGRVREVTAFPLPPAAPVEPAPPPPTVQTQPEPRRFGFWMVFGVGFAVGTFLTSGIVLSAHNARLLVGMMQ